MSGNAMVAYRIGGKGAAGRAGRTVELKTADDRLALRIAGNHGYRTTGLDKAARTVAGGLRRETTFARNQISVMRTTDVEVGDALAALKKDDGVAFAGHLLVDADTDEPIIYREKLFLAFRDDAGADRIRKFLMGLCDRLVVDRQVKYARHAFVVRPQHELGRSIFDLSLELLEHDIVDRCHPEVLREKVTKAVFPGQWHLASQTIGGVEVAQSASVEAAWAYATGKGVKIAVIDDGVDVMHPEFVSSGKVVDPFDSGMGAGTANPQSVRDNHGTCCAGVACAAGVDGASGVAPDAMLMPIRNVSDLGSFEEADAIWWAVDHGADVISCSWGPRDGDWSNAADPLHQASWPIVDNTALAIEAAARSGRSGRGCVIVWAAGNGNESVDLDGWAAHPEVMAVAACNDGGVRSAYSDFGNAISCAFPSNDTVAGMQTSGIWTTDRRAARGYNSGNTGRGDAAGNYTNSFGGTSSACPGVAGLAALLISADLAMPASAVRAAIEGTADKIDQPNGKWSGGRSPFYGAGRVNAEAAVKSVWQLG
jgi:subtilisin family serine protease